MRAIKIQEKAFGPNHPSLASSLGTRATVLEAQVCGSLSREPCLSFVRRVPAWVFCEKPSSQFV